MLKTSKNLLFFKLNKHFLSRKIMDSSGNYFKTTKNNNDIILTPNEGYDSCLIFMHGLGDSALGFRDFFDSKYKPIPSRMKVILLTAPMQPVTLNGGMIMNSWYDIKSLKRKEDDIEESDVNKSAFRVNKVIDTEAKNLDNKYNKIFLGGFSQGACLSLHIGLTMKETLGGLIIFSGFLFPFTTRDIQDDKKGLPIIISHGIYDEMIPEPFAKATYQPLYDKKFNVTYNSYDEGHAVPNDSLDTVKEFIIKHLV
jgi:predicted esterase